MDMTRPLLELVILATVGCGGAPAAYHAQPPGRLDSAPGGADARTSFYKGCLEAPDHQAWCDCGWQVLSPELTPSEMKGGDIPKDKHQRVALAMQRSCSDKLPESVRRAAFVDGCTQNHPTYRSYCECYWPELRRTFSAAEVGDAGTVKSPRFKAVGREVARTCSPKLPEQEVKSEFVQGCTEDMPGGMKFCECAWNEIRAVLTPGEITMSATTDSDAFVGAQDNVRKRCSQLRPGR